MWQAEEVCNGYVAETASKKTRISKVPGPENVADANTKPADERSFEFCRSKMGVTEIPKQFRDAVLSFCFCVIVHDHVCSTSLQVLQANVMSHHHDSEIVNRLWSDRPQPSGDANIIRCLWCLTLLMNWHDFVTESFNPEHIFRDVRTVSFCLTTDHISTCLIMFSTRCKTAQFWSVLIRGEWKCSICSYQRR